MKKDTASDRETFFEEEVRALRARLDELRPAVAEAERIKRRLVTIDALRSEGKVDSDAKQKPRKRKRYSTETRALQALEVISEQPEELRRKDMARILGVQASRAGKIVCWLVERGLVEDRGGGTLAMTEKAERLRRDAIQSEGPGFSVEVKGPVEGGSA